MYIVNIQKDEIKMIIIQENLYKIGKLTYTTLLYHNLHKKANCYANMHIYRNKFILILKFYCKKRKIIV